MTTIEAKMIEMLCERGLFEDQAQVIVNTVKKDKINEAMKGRWFDDIEDYPDALLAVLWFSVKKQAIEWIKSNKPQAWYRPLFESDEKNE